MKVLILAGYTRSFFFRRALIKQMIDSGHEVIGCAPDEDIDGICGQLGITFERIKYGRSSTNIVEDSRLIRDFRKLIADIKPDLIFCYSIKPNIYGSLMAAKEGISNIHILIAGMGNVFIEGGGIKRKILRQFIKELYKRATNCCKSVIFQNSDDKEYMFRINPAIERKAHVVNGSGVDMDYFTPMPLPKTPSFLMVSRLLREKGVMEYLKAARTIKQKFPGTRILLLGSYERNGFALHEEDILPYVQQGIIEHIGDQNDVRPFYQSASIVVLPSYREGTPRTILEAMACGRAVITTDVPGCRETVIHGKTGLLVPPGNVEALADAMRHLLLDPDKVRRMGREGLAYCGEKYEISKINARMLEILGL